MQSGVVADVLRGRLPECEVVQLAKYAGGSPIGVLRVLAADNRFRGIVVCDAIEPFLMREHWNDQSELTGYRGTMLDCMEAFLSANIRDCLAIANHNTGIRPFLKEIAENGGMPSADLVRMHVDRTIEINFDERDKVGRGTEGKLAMYRKGYERLNLPSSEVLASDFEWIDDLVLRIENRGGRVVFVRMPSSGARLELENEYHPKEDYWDRLAEVCRGEWIHATELKGAHRWECPDDSHLDYRSAIRFTDALLEEMLIRGVLDDPNRR